MRISGRSPDGKFVEIAELPGHPWFVAVQFHPEFQSRPLKPHPLFASFVARRLPAEGRRRRAPRSTPTSLGVMHAVQPVAAGAVTIGTGHPLAFIVGPCVIESPAHALDIAVEHRRRSAGALRRAA